MSKSILIVEDNRDMQALYEAFFNDTKGAYNVEIAGDGVSAFKKLQAKKYDLIILDMVMEPMSGEILFAMARDASINAETPVMVVSILGPRTTAVEHILGKKDTYHMKKPVSQEDLLRDVEKILSS